MKNYISLCLIRVSYKMREYAVLAAYSVINAIKCRNIT